MCLELEEIDSEALLKIKMKLLLLEGDMTLFAVTIQRKVRRWFNTVTEIDVCIDPLCFDVSYRKKFHTIGKIWKKWNNF